jgi:hypothetical protein
MKNIKPTFTGSHGPYLWLTTEQHDLHTLLQRCPQALVGKYIAVTSLDSGPLVLDDEEKLAGWQSRNQIAYSPEIQSAEGLRGVCGGFDEWYVGESPFDLGQLRHDNVFENPMAPGQVSTFVNYCLALHKTEMQSLIDLLWKQLDWMQPESYIADADQFLTFASRNKELFASVRQALGDPALNSR